MPLYQHPGIDVHDLKPAVKKAEEIEGHLRWDDIDDAKEAAGDLPDLIDNSAQEDLRTLVEKLEEVTENLHSYQLSISQLLATYSPDKTKEELEAFIDQLIEETIAADIESVSGDEIVQALPFHTRGLFLNYPELKNIHYQASQTGSYYYRAFHAGGDTLEVRFYGKNLRMFLNGSEAMHIASDSSISTRAPSKKSFDKVQWVSTKGYFAKEWCRPEPGEVDLFNMALDSGRLNTEVIDFLLFHSELCEQATQRGRDILKGGKNQVSD